jgi:hypothetical protein
MSSMLADAKVLLLFHQRGLFLYLQNAANPQSNGMTVVIPT